MFRKRKLRRFSSSLQIPWIQAQNYRSGLAIVVLIRKGSSTGLIMITHTFCLFLTWQLELTVYIFKILKNPNIERYTHTCTALPTRPGFLFPLFF
jgi:hypothetical protein